MPKDIKEIEYKKNNRLGWIAFFVLVIHFGLILFSIFPQTPFTSSINKIGMSYVNPIFKQQWAMFAPCPVFENRLKIKYFFENDTSDWIDPIDNSLVKHQFYRFTYHGNIAVGYYNMLYWFKTVVEKHKTTANNILFYNKITKINNKKENALLNNYLKGVDINKRFSTTKNVLFFGKVSSLRKSKENRLLYNYVKGYANDNFNRKPLKSSLRISYHNIEKNVTSYYYFSDYK